MSDQEYSLSASERNRRLEHLEQFKDAVADPLELQKLKALLTHYLKPEDQDDNGESA